MKKQATLFNPYGLLFMAVFLEYFPSYFQKPKPTIALGPIHLFITDIAFLWLLGAAGLISLSNRSRSRDAGTGIRIIFLTFFLYSCIKWAVQSDHGTGSVRMMVSYAFAYVFLFFFPRYITTKKSLNTLLSILVVFLVYIFILHIYAFATQGYKIHILSGGFLPMLGMLYFLAMRENDILRLSAAQAFVVKALVVVTYLMVGHRSGLVALLLGLIIYSFFYKKAAMKEILVLTMVVVVGAGAVLTVSPKMLEDIEDRTSTTFDTSQDTYQGRYNNIFTVLELSKENPLIGKPLVTNESIEMKSMDVTSGSLTTQQTQMIVSPHNLMLEWLLYYGWMGVLLGATLLLAIFKYFKRFFKAHDPNTNCYKMAVVLLCTTVHNLFFAFSNVTINDVFSTFFLYFPVVILIALGSNTEKFCE